jgi:hypothetical protein
MKCPLCQNTFQAPALPPPVAPSPPPAPGAYGVANEPPAPAPPQEAPKRKKEAPPAPPTPPPPPVPTGDYTRTRTVWISPRVMPWLAPACLLVVFLLTFFPWATITATGGAEESHTAYGMAFGLSKSNALTIFFLVMMFLALPLSLAITALRQVPGFHVPAALAQVWPWRAALVALLAFVGLFFLLMQLFVGFLPSDPTLHTTVFTWLTLLLQALVLVGAVLDFWLEIRGPSRPTPRIDISW